MRHTHPMPRRWNVAAFLVGLSVWLAVLLLAFAAIQHFTDPISAQQTSTTAALPAPKNTKGVPGILCEPARDPAWTSRTLLPPSAILTNVNVL